MTATFRLALGVLLAAAPPVAAQDTLRLVEAHERASRRDPRGAQIDAHERITGLRLRGIDMEWRPQFMATGEAFHQSDVTTIRLALPGGAPPSPPKDRFQATLGIQQLVYDAGAASSRRTLERARLDESRAGVAVTLNQLRTDVDAAWFGAHLAASRAEELAAMTADLAARLDVARSRVREGAALPGDTAAIAAELLRLEQTRGEVAAQRRAALQVLSRFVERPLDTTVVLIADDAPLDAHDPARRDRPEFVQLAATRTRLEVESALTRFERRPRVSAFAQLGYGRPGLDQFRTEPDAFWIAGLRVDWRPWTWGSDLRQREIIEQQRRIVETEEAALSERLDRAVQGELETIAELARIIALDERIIGLRETVERQVRVQLDEGVVTAAEYVQARSDLLEARLARQRHRIEAAQARARYTTITGRNAALPEAGR